MQIISAELYALKIPFNLEFSHSRAKRLYSDSIILKLSTDEYSGYSEIIIREYVTGNLNRNDDNFKEAVNILFDFISPLAEASFNWVEISNYLNTLTISSKESPLLCGLEIALLDLLCKEERKDIYELLGTEPLRNSIYYSGVIPLVSNELTEWFCMKYKEKGVNSIRLKLGKDTGRNKQIVKIARKILGSDFDLRIDANMAWSYESAIENLELLYDNNITIVEEPLRDSNADMEKIMNHTISSNFQFMADEKIINTNDLYSIIKNKTYKMINIRLAKNGGLLKSLELAHIADENNIGYQFGCHVGETGILSAVGRVAASLIKQPRYIDGSFDSYLLSDNITTKDFTFGNNGIADIIRNQGLGFEIDEHKLNSLSIRSEVIVGNRCSLG